MDCCVRPYSLAEAMKDCVPVAWKNRVSIKELSDVQSERVHPVTPVEPEDTNDVQEAPTMPVSPYFPMNVLDMPLVGEHCALEAERRLAASLSSCIPGALSVDPYVRSLCATSGMKVSENAVWLLVIAMKLYASQCIAQTIETSKSIASVDGAISPQPVNRAHSVLGKRHPAAESPIPRKRIRCDGDKHRLSAFDFHSMMVSTSASGTTRSISRNLSRLAFENSLHASADELVDATTRDCDAVHRFLTAKLSVFTPAQEKHPQQPPPPSQPVLSEPPLPERRVSATSGGLGRGAKDLASLKARTTKGEGLRASPVNGATTPPGPSRSETPSTSAEGTDKPVTSPEDKSDANQQSARRGKGFGIKNLAAMRARSVTSSSTADDANVKANAALVAIEDEKAASVTETGGAADTSKPIVDEPMPSAADAKAMEGSTSVERTTGTTGD
jgi:hypothetical protein